MTDQNPENILAELDFEPEPEGLLDEPVDATAMLLRRLTWDTMPCDEVPEMLTALGLTHGTEEGMNLDHGGSHHRMSHVLPLEPYLHRLAEVLGVILSTAMATQANDGAGVSMTDEDSLRFAEQTAEVALHSTRAIIAQFMESGVLCYGPRVTFVYGGVGE